MTKIGVYDSGVGGLTTLRILERKFPFCDFYYLADNKNMPFGSKDEAELKEIVSKAVKKLKAHSEIQVLACNTASNFCEQKDVIKLSPPTTDDGKTLIMATPQTQRRLKESGAYGESRYSFANTCELASLVEVYVSVGARKNCLNMKELTPYLASKLFEFKGVQKIVLGCSHYLYLKNEISRILGAVEYLDGNGSVVSALEKCVEKSENSGKVEFDFTADDESAKYQKIYALLKTTRE
ncbi:MAG: hypothetical protein IK048_03365 [Clostridia bacterium]|nr:hypothetical protein [Clostridia bacterium]